MERFVGVDVADTRDDRLVEQGGLHGPDRPDEPAVEGLARDLESFGTQITQKPRLEVGSAPGEVHATEATGVDELEPMSAPIRRDDGPEDMPMIGNPATVGGRSKIDPTRHAESDDQSAVVGESKDQLLAASVDRPDRPIGSEQATIDPSRTTTIGITDDVPSIDDASLDPGTGEQGTDAASNRLDFGEFRHAGVVRDRVNARLYSGSRPSPPAASRSVRDAAAGVAPSQTGTTMTDSMLHQDDPVAAATAVRTIADRIRTEVGKVIVGQEEVLEEVLLAIFCGGHAIIEGVPGLAKTLLVHSLAGTLGLDFSRIQFTPDLMPTDMTGTEVIEEDRATGRRELRFVPGPIFANVILADEINRTPPKTQGALLEAMQERQVTVGGQTHVLPSPFFVLATQNPIEQEGTYPLPEAQLDRFMFNIRIGYPTEVDELAIVQRTTTIGETRIESVIDASDCLRIQQLVRQVPVADHVARYALRLVRATRVRESRDDKPEIVRDYLAWGAGPRASQFLVLAAKAMALTTGSTHVTPELVRAVALPVMRHRIIANFNAEADGVTTDDVVRGLLDTIPVDESDPSTRSTLDSVTR